MVPKSCEVPTDFHMYIEANICINILVMKVTNTDKRTFFTETCTELGLFLVYSFVQCSYI